MAVAIVLFAHGARDPAWAEPVLRVRSMMQTLAPETRVQVAFLEFMAPSLEDCCSSLASEGFERIVVLPMFIAQGGHLKNDVPRIMADLQKMHPAVRFELAQAIGEQDEVVRAMAKAGLALVE